MPPPHAPRRCPFRSVAPAGRARQVIHEADFRAGLVSQGRTYTIFRLSHRRSGVTVLRPQPVMSHHDEAPGEYFWDRGYKNRTVEVQEIRMNPSQVPPDLLISCFDFPY